MHERDRDTTLAAYRRTPWAILREMLPLIHGWVHGEMSDEELHAHAARSGLRAQEGSLVVAGGVAVIPLRGLITPAGSLLSLILGGGGGLRAFRESLREALASEEVSSILIDVDSPGGVTDLVPETAAEIRAAREQKPVTAIANTMAASAAYWLASQASDLVVTPSGWLGSIGVYMLHLDWSGNNAQVGVKPTYIAAGKYKVEGNPEEPLSESAREHMQEDVDRFYEMFLSDVAAGRKVDVETVRSDFGEGRILLAEPSLQAGLADRIESFEETVARLQAGGDAGAGAIAGPFSAPFSAEAINRVLSEAGYVLPRAEAPPAPAPEPEPPEPSADPEAEPQPEPPADPAAEEPPTDDPPDDEEEPEQPAALSVLDALTG